MIFQMKYKFIISFTACIYVQYVADAQQSYEINPQNIYKIMYRN